MTASVAYTLTDEVEDLQLAGAARHGTGNGADNRITGSVAADALAGLDGDDTILGMGGADRLDGGAGDDRLTGGLGVDLLVGGAGADRFIFFLGDSGPALAKMDRIVDFDHAQHDEIDLSSLAPGGGLTFVGTAAFSGVAGEVRYAFAATQTNVAVDFDGDRVADFGFHLNGQLALVATDFVLAA